MLELLTSFKPLRLEAFRRNKVDLECTIRNNSSETLWIELEVLLPHNLSLEREKDTRKARYRVGILVPGETRRFVSEIHGNSRTYPGEYSVQVLAYAFGKYGELRLKVQKQTVLRVVRIGEKV